MIKAAELAYVRVQVPDLEVAAQFYKDFGLVVRARSDDRMYLRGTGPEHHLLVVHLGERRLRAIAFEVASEADLAKAATISGASPIMDIDDLGGGRMVTLTDPDGNRLELVHGIARTDPLPVPIRQFNSAGDRQRRRNASIRLKREPAHVLRIGHAVLRSPEVARLSNWYQSVLGMIASDDVPLPDGSDLLMSFVRLDQGRTAVDHHVFQALKGPPNLLHHVSFEVQDIDDLHLGHYALREGGYEHIWGIGRHLQGSQIFDYWLDPFGMMFEHWIDTDVLDASVPTNIVQVDELETPWAPKMPVAFMEHGTR